MRNISALVSVICFSSVATLAVVTACSSSSGSGRRSNAEGDAGNDDPVLNANVTARLSSGVLLPSSEGPELIDPEVDETVVIPPAVTDDPVAINPGQVVQVQIEFEAPEGNVVAAGVRFGDEGPIRQIELPDAEGQTAGTLTFDMQIPADICDDAAQICHDIICNEFAITSAGEISRANVVQMGVVCSNACDEPTCQELLMCEMPTMADASTGPAPGGSADCAGACAKVASDCPAADSSSCVTECEQDQANAASCGEQAAWDAMLLCCQQTNLVDFCDEGGFDPCQKGACEDQRPAGAADGCGTAMP
jgi:hypothetical protein